MSTMRFSTTISRSISTVFRLISDLSGYHQWLPASNMYVAITQISDYPVKGGTTYLDQGSSAQMQGTVTEYQPPTHIVFQQSARISLLGWPARLTLRISYTLEPVGSETQVLRVITLKTQIPLFLLQPVLVRTIRRENERILRMMKHYLETRA